MVNVAVRAARRAGDVMIRYLNQLEALEVTDNGRNEFVTEVDHRAEQAIVEIIRDFYPDHAILAEERGQQGHHDFEWIIDPLDGTTNYAHGFPRFCVSIGVEHEGRVCVGVVYDPLLDELFHAVRGAGAWLGARRLAVSTESDFSRALVATGFAYDRRSSDDNNLEHFGAFLRTARALRRDGSAALDLCYVAAGRLEGFWELKLHAWDVAAGALIVEEAGGRVSDLRGGPMPRSGAEVLASNGHVHAGMLEVFEHH
jgi:myo-inositol-1(or 4)-monophosphatase